MAEANSTCNQCKFFHSSFGDRLGVCRRFPVYQNRSEMEWCGEFKTHMVALPVVEGRKIEFTVTPATYSDPEAKEAEIEITQTELKRRGRPKGVKND
jgi:hypothetical protein